MATELLSKYNRKRLDKRHEKQAKLEQLYNSIPEYESLEDQVRELVVEYNKARITNKDAHSFIEKINQLKAAQVELLIKAGYPADYLEISYDCDKCRDTGCVYTADKVSACSCYMQKLYQENYPYSSMFYNSDARFENSDLNIFSDTAYDSKLSHRQYMKLLIEQTHIYAHTYPNIAKKNLVILGPAGSGKTYLMQCIFKVLVDKGYMVLADNANDMFYRLKTSMFDNTMQDFDIYREAQILMIDDLGTEPSFENITIPMWYSIIDHRYNHKKTTIISSNLNPAGISRRYSNRLASRILDIDNSRVFEINGGDIRITKNNK